MRILNTSSVQLEHALFFTSLAFHNNVEFLTEPEQINKKGTSFKVRLTVKDSNKAGGRRSTSRTRKDGERCRVHAACWHVYGAFIDKLFEINPNVKIRTGAQKIDSIEDNWQDRNIGSMMYPCYYSEACDC